MKQEHQQFHLQRQLKQMVTGMDAAVLTEGSINKNRKNLHKIHAINILRLTIGPRS